MYAYTYTHIQVVTLSLIARVVGVCKMPDSFCGRWDLNLGRLMTAANAINFLLLSPALRRMCDCFLTLCV